MKTSTSCIERVLAAIEAASGFSFDINLVLTLTGRLDETILARAIGDCLAMEPVFGCRFQEGWWQPYWSLPKADTAESQLEVRIADDTNQALQDVLSREADARNGPGFRAFLLRGATDTLCLKLDHKLGDGQTLRLFGQLLAESYSRLLKDPDALTPAGSLRNRLVTQVMQDLPAEEKRNILRLAVANKGRFEQAAQWLLPRSQNLKEGQPRKRFLIRRLGDRQGEAIIAHARQVGVSVNTVLVSIIMRGALTTLSRIDDRRCELIQTVDLRRHSRAGEKPLYGNFSSMVPISIDAGRPDPLATLIPQVDAQLQAAKNEYLGLTHPLVRWEINPRRRMLFQCIPFRMLKRVTRRRLDALDHGDSPGRLVLSNVGTVDPAGFTFGETLPDGAFFTAGVLTCRQMILLAATQFRGVWTIVCGFSPRHIDESAIARFLDEIVANVPAPLSGRF